MNPPNHRTVTLAEAVEAFALDRLLGDDFDDLIGDCLDEEDSVLVFDGDTACAGDLELSRADPVAFGEPFDRWPHDLVIVDGNLAMGRIDMWQIRGLLVLGDLACDELHLREGYPLYVRGNLVARHAVRASAMEDDEQFGRAPLYARVQGTATSPVIQTWRMPLRHLAWTSDSGREEPLVLR